VIPSKNVPHDYVMSSSKEMADNYIALGEIAKAESILNELGNKAVEYITWYMSMNDEHLALSYEECLRNFYILDEVNKSLSRAASLTEAQPESEMKSSADMALHYAKKFEQLYDAFNMRVGRK